MTWIDVFPFVLLILYVVLGFFTGVVQRGIGLLALYVAFLAGNGMGLQLQNLLQQASTVETPDARIYGFFGLVTAVLVVVEIAAFLARAQIKIDAIVWNRLTGVLVGILTALVLSVLIVYELEAAGNPAGGGALDNAQAEVHDATANSHFIVPLVNAISKPIVAIFQPVLPGDPHQFFSRGPVS